MTRDEIMRMPAGPEMNALISADVMHTTEQRPWSEDLNEAYQAAQVILANYSEPWGREKNSRVSRLYLYVGRTIDPVMETIEASFERVDRGPTRRFVRAIGDTPAHAICRAILMATFED